MPAVAMGSSVPPIDRISSHSDESIEERCFSGCLICLEGHYTEAPAMGPLTAAKVTSMVSRTLEKTHTYKDVREALSKNVGIWMYLTKIFASAVPHLSKRSVGPLGGPNDPEKGVDSRESTTLILKHYATLKEDLQVLNKLMHIARNLLVTSEPEVPQDICAAVHFDQMVYQTIILCVNVTSKGYDVEGLDDVCKMKLTEITELYKKLMVTSLQQAHNWTAKNDRNKMSFWFDVLFDDDSTADDDETGFRLEVAKTEVSNWLERNSTMCDKARKLLREYADVQAQGHRPPGPLPPISPLAWNWLPEGDTKSRAVDPPPSTEPVWVEKETDKFEQDKGYGRVSHEIDMWWTKARDENYCEWKVPMPSVEFAQKRAEACKTSLLQHYTSYREGDFDDEDGDMYEGEIIDGEFEGSIQGPAHDGAPRHGSRSLVQGYVEDMNEEGAEEDEDDEEEEEDVDDAESYGDGPMTGLLTEIPNILDPKQIEALHMIVKSCIVDTVNSLAPYENRQRTRCRMFIALECGKSLLREMLVFIAVWEKDEASLIFQITTQIVEALHHNALLPYTWKALRIPKDITSPAQTVLLRLINHMYRTFPRGSTTTESPAEKHVAENRVKLLHFLFSNFRSRIVPECLALMVIQAHIREGVIYEADFPVDNWDMERAKDGLAQFLDFLITAAEDHELRSRLIEWDATYELVTLLRNLERAVEKKPLVSPPPPRNNGGDAQSAAAATSASGAPSPPPPTTATGSARASYSYEDGDENLPPPPPPPPPCAPPGQEPAYKYPWPEVKCQVLALLASLLQPPPGKTSPGNETVQRKVVQYNGMPALLNSSLYDDHNRFARERVQLCLKWLLDGGVEANQFVNNLVKVKEAEEAKAGTGPSSGSAQAPSAARAGPSTVAKSGTSGKPKPGEVTTVRIDGVEGEVKVKIQAPSSNNNPSPAHTGGDRSTEPSAAVTAAPAPSSSSTTTPQRPSAPAAAVAGAAAAGAGGATPAGPQRAPTDADREYMNKLSEAIESLVLPGLHNIGGQNAAQVAGILPGPGEMPQGVAAEQGAALLLESMIGLYQMGAQQRGIQVEVPEEWRRLLRDGWEARIPTVSEWLRQRVLEFEARIPEEFLRRVEEQHDARARSQSDGGGRG
ncbi:hypothetical protein RB595_003107 [Gaeumannomyces hyphopodioides]